MSDFKARSWFSRPLAVWGISLTLCSVTSGILLWNPPDNSMTRLFFPITRESGLSIGCPVNFVVINYLHFLGFGLLLAALVLELGLLRPKVSGRVARQLALADGMYGISALTVLITGLLKVFIFAKPAAYYGHNFLFHIKVTLFLVVAIMSIYPTLQFLRHRKAKPEAEVSFPPLVGTLVRVELALLVVIPLLAVMMAHGFGVTGK